MGFGCRVPDPDEGSAEAHRTCCTVRLCDPGWVLSKPADLVLAVTRALHLMTPGPDAGQGEGSAAAPCVTSPAELLAAASGCWKHDKVSESGIRREWKRDRGAEAGLGAAVSKPGPRLSGLRLMISGPGSGGDLSVGSVGPALL